MDLVLCKKKYNHEVRYEKNSGEQTDEAFLGPFSRGSDGTQ